MNNGDIPAIVEATGIESSHVKQLMLQEFDTEMDFCHKIGYYSMCCLFFSNRIFILPQYVHNHINGGLLAIAGIQDFSLKNIV